MNGGNTLAINIGADTSGLQRGLQQAQTMLKNFKQHVDKIAEVGDKLSDLGKTLSASLTLPIVGLGAASIKAYGDIEALKKGLEAVVGSADKANREFENLKEVAKLPGLGMKEAIQGSINLQAIGISAGKSRNILQQFGNAVATVGKGREEFERAIYGVQQLANTDFPLGEDLNIIKDAIPQVSNLLKDAFGSSRSDDLAKMGVSSQKVLDTILTGLEKLPRVSGGINGAFENLGDSMKTNLARIGDAINKNFDIAKIIDKITNAVDKIVSAFEDLNPQMQKVIIVVAALVAGIGPLLLVIGGIMTTIPVLTAGFAALGTAIGALSGPIGIIVLAVAALTAGLIAYYSKAETAEEKQEKWSKSLAKATASAQTEIAALDKLYRKTQDGNLSYKERQQAVDELQKQYPNYFKNIDDETIKVGKAAKTYDELRTAIMNASLARAAQSELDRRNEDYLKRRIQMQEDLNKQLKTYLDPKAVNMQISGGTGGAGVSIERTSEQVKEQAKNSAYKKIQAIYALDKQQAKENKNLIDLINKGAADAEKVYGDPAAGPVGAAAEGWKQRLEKKIKALDDAIDKAPTKALAAKLAAQKAVLEKELQSIVPKNETEKPLAEIFPIGSILELQQRTQLLKKAIDSSNNDLVRLRKLNKYGEEKDEKGNVLYTGEVITKQAAMEELDRLNKEIRLKENNSLEERAKDQEAAWKKFSAIRNKYGEKVVKEQGLEGNNYLDFLDKAKEKLEGKLNLGLKLSDQEKTDLLWVSNTLNDMYGIQSPFEKWTEDIQNALSLFPSFNGQMDYLSKVMDKVSQDGNTDSFVQRAKFVNDLNLKILKNQQDFYNKFVSDNLSFEVRKTGIESQYNDVRKRINEDVSISATEKLRLLKKTFKDQNAAIFEATSQLNQQVSTLLNESVLSGIFDSVSALGNALASGTNVIQAVGTTLLASLGSIMMDLGKLAIKTGLGVLAIQTALKSLNPYVAIAAGAALVALGALVKGSVSQLGGSSGTGSSSGSGSSGGFSTSTGASSSGQSYSSSLTPAGTNGNNEYVFRIAGTDLVSVLERQGYKNIRLNAGK